MNRLLGLSRLSCFAISDSLFLSRYERQTCFILSSLFLLTFADNFFKYQSLPFEDSDLGIYWYGLVFKFLLWPYWELLWLSGFYSIKMSQFYGWVGFVSFLPLFFLLFYLGLGTANLYLFYFIFFSWRWPSGIDNVCKPWVGVNSVCNCLNRPSWSPFTVSCLLESDIGPVCIYIR